MPGLPAALTYLALVLPTLIAWLYFVALAGAGESNPLQQGVYALGKVVQFGLPLAHLALTRRRPRWPAHPWRGTLPGLAFGALVSAAFFALYLGLLRDSPLLAGTPARVQGKVREMGVEAPAAFFALAAFVALLHSLLEEYYWRWFVYGQLRDLLGPGPASAVAALGFAAHHVILLAVYLPGQFLTLALPFSAGIAIGGAFWASLYDRSGSLMGPWLGHGLIDAAIFTVGWLMLPA